MNSVKEIETAPAPQAVRSVQKSTLGILYSLSFGHLLNDSIQALLPAISILGMAPFALLLPHANLLGTAVLSVINGLILASAFPAILVYATELLPGKVGTIAGLFFGFAFGLAGIASAVLGKLADATSIAHVVKVCSFLPLIGLLTAFLPELKEEET